MLDDLNLHTCEVIIEVYEWSLQDAQRHPLIHECGPLLFIRKVEDKSPFLCGVFSHSPNLGKEERLNFVAQFKAQTFGVFLGSRSYYLYDARHSNIETSCLSHVFFLYCCLNDKVLTFLSFYLDVFLEILMHYLHHPSLASIFSSMKSAMAFVFISMALMMAFVSSSFIASFTSTISPYSHDGRFRKEATSTLKMLISCLIMSFSSRITALSFRH
ncbi:hypothetical protein L7F22_040696 [Adiantum nelumboides]|nr:hypothetical protein [Adiantum nelumboides]